MISCIISTYKRRPEILMRAIMSARTQTYQDIEIIVVNDAPEEIELEAEIRSMIEELQDKRIHYIVHEKNCGACAARNTGARIAKGEYLAFLDDDDEWLPEKLEEQLKLMEDPEVGFVTCDNYEVFQDGAIEERVTVLPKEFSTDLEVELTGNYLGGVSFPLIRSSTFFEAGQFDEDLRSGHDTDLYIRLLKCSKLAICHQFLVNYYHTNGSISANIPAKLQGYQRMERKYREDYKKYPEVYRVRLLWTEYAFVHLGAPVLALQYAFRAFIHGAGVRRVGRYWRYGYRDRKRDIANGRMR